jgi:hypothetical protein
MAEIEAGEVAGQGPVFDETPVIRAGSVSPWRRSLLFRLAKLFGCVSLVSRVRAREKGRHRPDIVFILFGEASDVALARELYALVSLQIATLAARTDFTRKSRVVFCLGCVHGITLQMELAQAAERAATAASTTALAIVDNRLARASEALEREHPSMSKERKPRKVSGDAAAYQAGLETGRRMPLPAPRAPKLTTT